MRERVFIIGLREDVESAWTWPKPVCRTKGERISIAAALDGLPDPRSEENRIPDHVFMDGARTYAGNTGSDVSLPSKTVKAGAHGVPGGENTIVLDNGSVRYYTVRESARIQTFPDDYVFSSSWTESMRQIGNAVPVKLAHIVGASIHDTMERMKQNAG